MENLVKVGGAAVAGCAIGLVLRKNNPESSLLISIAISIFAAYISFEVMSSVLSFLRSLADEAGIPVATLAVVLRTAGISILTKLISDICKDAGQAGAASGVEFAGAVTAIYVALPLFRTALDMINTLLQ